MDLELEKGEELAIELSLAGFAKEPVKLAPISDTPITIPLKKLGGTKTVVAKPPDQTGKPPEKGLIPDPYGGQVPDLQDDPYK